MFSSKIIGFESYLPENIITNDQLSNIVETSDEWIYTRTGISKRHISTKENTSDFAINVGKKLIEKNNISPEDIDIVIVATITPDYLTPSTACIVQGAIGAKNALAFDINVACSGFVYALSIADKFLKSGLYKNALVIGSETLSKIIDWTDRGTCVLFGDGAGGVLLTSNNDYNSILAEDLKADGMSWQAITGGKLNLNNPFTENKEENSFYLQMNGRDVFNFATKTVPKSINQVLEKANITLDDIKYIVPHQANLRIVEVVAKKLNVNLDKFYLNLQNYGNTSAASISIALAEMSKNNLLQKGDKIIITGFGAGLTWASMLIQI
ncbi:beta-ketoacyl-ACP synthase III [[Clostridium] colinum]|uniref:beta-ketoacyl-ACP synthase III n=1 Tax=[Clostridium] colinum TaxID=36835 RepID=UPI002024CC58|nr:beta-ketoacyl-ACP synthase III [[Clostridium] colinum]